jgi:hypothetical protein
VGKKKQRVKLKERILSWRQARSKRRVTRSWNWLVVLKVAVVLCFLALAGLFLRYAEGYVRSEAGGQDGALILVDVPGWANWDLKARVAAMAGGSRFPIVDETAGVVARNLAAMAWLDDLNVQVTHDSVRVKARWRKPLALLVRGPSKFYVDSDLVVLDYLPMPHLPIVEVTGLTMGFPPSPGEVFDREELAAAVRLIELLHRMDGEVTPKSPLLRQIARIDIGNYHGQKAPRQPHVVLYTQDDTQIIWGAEIGEWARHLEAKDEQKLAKLYTYYKEYGSLSAGVKYINLRDPQDRIPQPIDKYRY